MGRGPNHLKQISGRTRDAINLLLAPHTNLSYEINQVSSPILVLNPVTYDVILPQIYLQCVISTGQTHKKVCTTCARRLDRKIKNRAHDLSEDDEDFWIEEIQKRNFHNTSGHTNGLST